MDNIILSIEQDPNPISPWERGETEDHTVFISNTPRNIGSINSKKTTGDYQASNTKVLVQRIRDDLPGKGWVIYPVRAYIHSGIALSLGSSKYPFNCPWDSGLGGFLCFNPIQMGLKGNANIKAPKIAEGIIEEWNQYLSGDVWGYTISTKDGTILSSVWGYYGRDYCEEEAKAELKYYQEQEKKESEAYNKYC